ncbi:MAG: Lrp/AsnC family transcriptional regulator [Thermoleophilia bacterium]
MEDAPAGKGLDTADQGILDALNEDPRMSFAEIARRMGVSPGMVRQRFQRMQDAGVIRIAAITNPLLTGASLMAVIALRVDVVEIERISEEVSAFDEVVYLVVLAGSYDLLAEARFRDQSHMLEFLSTRLRAIEGVRDSETFVNLKIVKETYY